MSLLETLLERTKMTDQEIYQKLIDYLDNPVWGFPESEHLMPMITSFITPEEAEFRQEHGQIELSGHGCSRDPQGVYSVRETLPHKRDSAEVLHPIDQQVQKSGRG
jgi:hypothetical protein